MFVPLPHPDDPKRQLLIAAENIAGVDFSQQENQTTTVWLIQKVAGLQSITLDSAAARDLRSALSLD